MKISINTLCWDNVNPIILDMQKKVMNRFEIPIEYTLNNIHHGAWIDQILNTKDADVYVFFDSDCIPLSREAFDESLNYCINGYLVGNVQVTNCIKAKHDFFCGPSFFMISRSYYERIGKPSAVNNRRSDVAQELTRSAVDLELRLKMNFPKTFQGVPQGGIWRLSGYGYYGVGTVYDDKYYHLWQSRFKQNIELFQDTCECVLRGDLASIKRTYDCRSEYAGILPIEDDYGY